MPDIFYNPKAGNATSRLYSPTRSTALYRSHVGEHQRPRDVAGDGQKQDRLLLGRAGRVSYV